MEYDCYKADRLGKKARIVGFLSLTTMWKE